MDISYLIKTEYIPMCESIFKYSTAPFFEKISNLIVSGVARSDVYTILNDWLKRTVTAETVDPQYANDTEIINCSTINKSNNDKLLLVYVKDIVDKSWVHKIALQHAVQGVRFVLPHMQPGFKIDPRFIIDKILTDGQLKKCTDVHILPVADFNGSYEYVVRYRNGLFLEEVTKEYPLTSLIVDKIIHDMIANRSSSSFKASKVLTDTEVKFRLIDPLYPSRCEVVKTIWGPGLVVRFFDFKTPFRLNTLGFGFATQRDLKSLSQITSGLSLVTGVIGSGKGTTINSIALEIQDTGKYSIMSIDSPTEYLGRFPQIEYQSDQHLYDACNAVKKCDINFVLLNEIATQETARAVYNLVVSGVHVLTTIHNNRVYRVMYKLREMLGDLYLNLIPFLNFVSYQDKFSRVCSCKQSLHRDFFGNNPDKTRLLDFLGLEIIQQPTGCEACGYTGIQRNGIQVMSEHIIFNSKLKDKLLRADIHEQATILQENLKDSVNLENELKEKLKTGDVLIDEVVNKLDTWR